MLRIINKKKIYFYLFSYLFLTTIFNSEFTTVLKKKFEIKNIYIDVETEEVKEIIFDRTNFLVNKNIFYTNEEIFIEKLNNLNFLENISIFKNYPSTINIKAQKTKIIAITYFNQKKYYVGENGKLISVEKISNENELPIVFGNFDISEFMLLKKILSEQNINYKNVTKYYYHKNKRWDLYFKNNILVKLPNNNIRKAIKLYKNFNFKNEVKSNTIIDLRIHNRLVVNHEN